MQMGGKACWDPGCTQDPVASLLETWFAGARKGLGKRLSWEEFGECFGACREDLPCVEEPASWPRPGHEGILDGKWGKPLRGSILSFENFVSATLTVRESGGKSSLHMVTRKPIGKARLLCPPLWQGFLHRNESGNNCLLNFMWKIMWPKANLSYCKICHILKMYYRRI